MGSFRIVTLAIAFLVGGQGAPARASGQMAFVGWIRDGDTARLTGQWLALVEQDRGFELREVTVGRKREHPVCGDPGYALIAPGVKASTLLLRGLAQLKTGPVVTAFAGGKGGKFLLPGERLDLALGGDDNWSLHAFGTVRPAVNSGLGAAPITNYEVHMVGRGRSATVFSLARVGNDGPPQILWAGDLDGDRVADVLVELQGYPGSRRAVFLSSFAEPGQLVGKAASLDTAGC